MSDPNNQYPAFDQSPYGQASYGQAPQGAYGQAQPGYGQAPQVAYGQAYMLNPALEKIRSNASTARLLAILSFLFGGLLLSGGMWFWANNMLQEAQMLGAPIDVVDQARSAQSTAKICSIIHIVFIVAGLVIGVIFVVLGLIVAGAAGH